MPLNLSKLAHWTYLANIRPPIPSAWMTELMSIVFGASIIAALVIHRFFLRRIHGPSKRTARRSTHLLLSFGLVSFLLLFFRVESAYYLSMRLWQVAWTIYCALWALHIAYERLTVIPKRTETIEGRKIIDTYLPKKKARTR